MKEYFERRCKELGLTPSDGEYRRYKKKASEYIASWKSSTYAYFCAFNEVMGEG